MNRKHYLSRHGKYVDYRIALLGGPNLWDEEECASACGMVSYLMDHAPLPAALRGEPRRALEELKDLLRRWDILRDGDLLGYIHQELQSRKTRKKHGRYFTPRDIVDYIVSRALAPVPGADLPLILDPACGSGQFLIAAYALLSCSGNRRGSMRRNTEELIHHRIHGIDNDQVAASICRWNLSRVSGINESEIKNIHNNNYLFKSLRGDSRDEAAGYTAVIGNPPWGSRLSADERRAARERFSSAGSGINTFTLFIERTRRLLAPGGTMAFLLPEAYLNIGAHSASRRQVLDHMRILDIAAWGERFRGVFAPSVSFIAAREDSASARSRHVVRISSAPAGGSATATLIPQAQYDSTPQNIFNIHYSRRAVELISRMEDEGCFYLKGSARFFLGVVTGDNPHHLRDARSEDAPDPIIVGRDLSQYRIDFSGHHFRFDPGALQQVAPRQLYLTPNKLLYKFIGRRLVFALDTEGRYSLNNVNAFIPGDKMLEPECLLALLNSRLMQYYYEKNFFTVKVLRGNLERLPLRTADGGTRRKIRSLVRRVMESPDSGAGMRSRETIEDIVFSIYGIGDAEAARISEAVLSPAPALSPQ
ncbi:MAG TPA: TaqI-like C-terminal specificity domain-containing protein [Spirochaetota bacterium]|nr:TaqI-like C-terminal specificity domain-containing protein [Spirochaetota bacterium]